VRRLIWLFTFILLLAAVTGCTPPVGQIGGTAGDDQLLAVPQRSVYNVNSAFFPDTDVRVFTTYRGRMQPISIEHVSFGVVENLYQLDNIFMLSPGEGYLFEFEGRKIIVVSYNNLSTRYSVEVQDPFGIGNGNGGGTNDGGGTVIVWSYPRSVSFNANGGLGTPPAMLRVDAGTTITIPGPGGLSRTGYVFAGWSGNNSGTGIIFEEGDDFIVIRDAVFFARWVLQ